MVDKKTMNVRLDMIRDFTETEGVKQLVDVIKEIINDDKPPLGFKSKSKEKK